MKKILISMLALFAIATTASAAEYDIWVGGVKVTDSNKTNITGSAIKKGKVMYEPSTKALVLTDVEIYRNEGDVIANTGVEGLVIIFEGTNRLTSNNNEDGAILLTKKTTISCSRNSKTNIYAEHHISTHMVKRAIYKPNANLTITGSGKLYIRSYGNGIEGKSYQNSSDVMTIKDAKVEIDTSDPALVDFSNITIEGNAKLTLNHRWDGTTSPRLFQVAKITLNDEQHICEPEGAVFSSTAKTIVLNNEPVSNKTIDINAEKIPLDNNSIVADANFRSYLKTTFANGKNHLMMCEAAKITRIDVNNKEISSLKGIECFTGLTTLFCYSNKLKELDVSKNTALTDLRCQDNQLTALDITKNTALKQLYCNTNKLTSLDVRFNTALTYLRCHDNQLSKLNVQTLPALTYLRCYRNKIGEWDMRNLVESLPKVSSGEGQFYVVYMDDSEENFIRPYVVNMAKEKGWKVFGFNGTDWKNYAGGILIKAKSDNASYGTVKGAGTYEKGATITLTATPNKGYKFVRWKVYDGSITTTVSGATATYSFIATEDVAYDEYIAVFEKVAPTGIEINETNFPDANFRKIVAAKSIDKDEDGYLSDEEIAAVKTLDVSAKRISKLYGIGFFTALETLQCQTNSLTALDLSENKNLKALACYGNWIKDDKMTALVNSLPKVPVKDRSGKVQFGALVVIDSSLGGGILGEGRDQNAITKEQVAIAKDKNWKVFDNNGGKPREYAGSGGTTGLTAVESGQLTVDSWYSIDGVKLQGEPTKKGVYIYKGKKVVKK